MAMIRNPGECSCIGMCTTIFEMAWAPRALHPSSTKRAAAIQCYTRYRSSGAEIVEPALKARDVPLCVRLDIIRDCDVLQRQLQVEVNPVDAERMWSLVAEPNWALPARQDKI